MGDPLGETDDPLVFVVPAAGNELRLDGGRRVEFPDLPLPVLRSSLEPFRDAGEIPLGLVVEGILTVLSCDLSEEDREAYRRFLFHLEPRCDELIVAKALVLANQGQTREACTWFMRLVALCPDHASGWMNLGLCLRDLSDLEPSDREELMSLACLAFQRALELDPRLAPAYLYLGCLLRDRGLTDAARPAWRLAAWFDDEPGGVAGSALRLLGDPDPMGAAPGAGDGP